MPRGCCCYSAASAPVAASALADPINVSSNDPAQTASVTTKSSESQNKSVGRGWGSLKASFKSRNESDDNDEEGDGNKSILSTISNEKKIQMIGAIFKEQGITHHSKEEEGVCLQI